MLMIVAFCALIVFSVLTWSAALHVIERLMRENRELEASRDHWFKAALDVAGQTPSYIGPEPPYTKVVIKGEHGFLVFDQ